MIPSRIVGVLLMFIGVAAAALGAYGALATARIAGLVGGAVTGLNLADWKLHWVRACLALLAAGLCELVGGGWVYSRRATGYILAGVGPLWLVCYSWFARPHYAYERLDRVETALLVCLGAVCFAAFLFDRGTRSAPEERAHSA